MSKKNNKKPSSTAEEKPSKAVALQSFHFPETGEVVRATTYAEALSKRKIKSNKK